MTFPKFEVGVDADDGEEYFVCPTCKDEVAPETNEDGWPICEPCSQRDSDELNDMFRTPAKAQAEVKE